MLAYSYSIVNDTDNAKDVFEESMSFLHSIDFRNIQTLDYIYPRKSMNDAFYHQSIPYLQAEEDVCLEEARPYEYVQITASSEELLEVIESGKAI